MYKRYYSPFESVTEKRGKKYINGVYIPDPEEEERKSTLADTYAKMYAIQENRYNDGLVHAQDASEVAAASAAAAAVAEEPVAEKRKLPGLLGTFLPQVTLEESNIIVFAVLLMLLLNNKDNKNTLKIILGLIYIIVSNT